MKKQRILTILGVFLLLLLIHLNFGSIIEGLSNANYVLVCIAVLCWFCGGSLRAIRWRALLSYDEEVKISLSFAMRVLLGSFFLESIGPKIGSDIYRGTLLWTTSNKHVSFSKSFGIIVFERFLDFCLKLLIAVIGVFLLGEAVSELGGGSTAAILFSLCLLCGFAVFLFFLSREEVAIAISERWVKIAGPKKDSLAGRIDPRELSRLASIFVSLAKSRRDVARSGTLTLGVFVADLFVWILILDSVGARPAIFMLAFIMSVVTLAVFISMFPGGYGVREIAGTVALIWAGVESEVAVTALVALRLFNLLMNIVIGGLFFVATTSMTSDNEILSNKLGPAPIISASRLSPDPIQDSNDTENHIQPFVDSRYPTKSRAKDKQSE